MNTEKLKPLTDDELHEIIIETRRNLRFAKDFARSIDAAYEKVSELQFHHIHAVSHEREQCAKIADEVAASRLTCEPADVAEYIAELIRARGKV